MTDKNRKVLDQIKAVARESAPKGSLVILFGSRARGEARRGSDWDILFLKLWIDSRICFSVSSTILSCCKDIDAISFYLFAEEWTQVVMILNQIDLAS